MMHFASTHLQFCDAVQTKINDTCNEVLGDSAQDSAEGNLLSYAHA
jgi:hypothetical protein